MCDCLFCEIIKGNVPCFKIYEDTKTIVFLAPEHDVDGHMVVIPKLHCKNILDCEEKTLHSFIDTVKAVSQHCVNNCGYDGVNILNASDESAGQSVHHLHFHLIPRKNSDNIDAWPVMHSHKYTLDEMQKKLEMR